MFTKTKIALAATILFGAASAALANDIDTSPSTAQSVREWQEYQGQTSRHMGNAGATYDYFASPTDQDLSQSRKKGHSR